MRSRRRPVADNRSSGPLIESEIALAPAPDDFAEWRRRQGQVRRKLVSSSLTHLVLGNMECLILHLTPGCVAKPAPHVELAEKNCAQYVNNLYRTDSRYAHVPCLAIR